VVKFLLVYAASADVAALSVLYNKPYTNAAFANWAAKIANMTAVDSDLVDDMVETVEDSFYHGKSVVLIGHGLGNRYIDAIYRGIKTKNRPFTQMLYISTPLNATINATSSRYVNRVDDLVLSNVADSLTGNIGPFSNYDTPMNHNMVFGYLNHADISAMIQSKLNELAAIAEYPNDDASFMVKMTMPSSPPITVTVTEPSGLVVNAKQRYGTFGYFTKSGRNLYFTGCGVPGLGRWTTTVDVGFAFGTVAVKVAGYRGGKEEFNEEQSLPPGTFGGEVIITEDENGDKEYEFGLL